MKIGAENRKKTILAVSLFIMAVIVVVWSLTSSPSPKPSSNRKPSGSAPTKPAKGASPIYSNLDPSLRLDLLKGSEEVAYEGTGHDIFRAKAAPTPPPVALPTPGSQVFVPAAAPTPPPLPPIHLKFYGFASNKGDNVKRVFLSEGEYIFIAKEGDIVKGRYRIVRVNPNNIEVEDVLNNNRQAIPLTAS